MADSMITKRALAAAIKELMNEKSFEKINVTEISERCGMNRKSFYYHFKDKYDLVNWIFYSEFSELTADFNEMDTKSYEKKIMYLRLTCEYFYENRTFYKRVLQIQGQNSFSDYFLEYIKPLIQSLLSENMDEGRMDSFSLCFYTDACYCAIVRWLNNKDCMKPEEFVGKIEQMLQDSAAVLKKQFN